MLTAKPLQTGREAVAMGPLPKRGPASNSATQERCIQNEAARECTNFVRPAALARPDL